MAFICRAILRISVARTCRGKDTENSIVEKQRDRYRLGETDRGNQARLRKSCKQLSKSGPLMMTNCSEIKYFIHARKKGTKL